jgi:hypothetical protein
VFENRPFKNTVIQRDCLLSLFFYCSTNQSKLSGVKQWVVFFFNLWVIYLENIQKVWLFLLHNGNQLERLKWSGGVTSKMSSTHMKCCPVHRTLIVCGLVSNSGWVLTLIFQKGKFHGASVGETKDDARLSSLGIMVT